jgi:hypothetical protein
MDCREHRAWGLWLTVWAFLREGSDDEDKLRCAAMCAGLKVEEFRAMVTFWRVSYYPVSIADH